MDPVDIKTLPKEKLKEILELQRPKTIFWYALCVTALHEKKIRDAINERGKALADSNTLDYEIKAWIPIRPERHKWSDRIKTIDVVQVPGIVFVRLKQIDKQHIYINSHIKNFLYSRTYRAAEPIPTAIMNNFIDKFDSGEEVDISMREPEVGDKVKMLTGSMKGIVGRLVRAEGHDRFRVKFSEFTFSFVVHKEKFAPVSEETESDPIYVRLEEENEVKVEKPEATARMTRMDEFEAKPFKEANAKFHRESRKKKKEKESKEPES